LKLIISFDSTTVLPDLITYGILSVAEVIEGAYSALITELASATSLGTITLNDIDSVLVADLIALTFHDITSGNNYTGISRTTANAKLGTSVAISNDSLKCIIGAPGENPNTNGGGGRVYLMSRTDTNTTEWTLDSTLDGKGGQSVAIS
jgi:hypothetical protein